MQLHGTPGLRGGITQKLQEFVHVSEEMVGARCAYLAVSNMPTGKLDV
jgi:hypothetical protein